MNSKPVIMVVEDEKVISGFLSAQLEANGYKVVVVEKGNEAISLASSYCPDLILLDLGLPDLDGIEVLESIREWSSTPIIVVSAREHESQKVGALDKGADDYITKPFNNNELLARVRTALRRGGAMQQGSGQLGLMFAVGDLLIDYDKRKVSVEGQPLHLTPIEYRMLTLLSSNAGRVLTHAYLLKEIWGPFVQDNQLLRVNMANIRRKIEKEPADPRYILTEIGVGYRMVEAFESEN